MKKKNNLLNWFYQEGTIEERENVFFAPKAFIANTFVNWIKKQARNKNLTPGDVEKNMHILRLFLKEEVELEWKGDTIRVIKPPSPAAKKEAHQQYREASNIE